MNKNTLTHPASRARGITLVEILLAISLLVILLSFALPSAGTASARSELKAAEENIQYSIDTARNVARMSESSVSLNIETAPGDAGQVISFSHPQSPGRNNSPAIQEYRLPDGIQLESDRQWFVFDRRGMVDQPGKIRLVARADGAIASEMQID
jgi:type II secretory pathway pseudopilin PulG